MNMEKKLRVGILGATGMVGQRFITLLANHPWYEITALAASPRSAGKTYEEAVGGRWKMQTPMPECVKKMAVMNVNEIEKVASEVDFVFSAVDMTKEEIRAIEDAYAKTETPVVSNNSAHRWTPDVPMVVPEINPEHFKVIEFQKKRLGTKRGFVAVKPNCSIQSYAPVLTAWKEFEPYEVVATTYQAISGAGKTFKDWPEMEGNIIPYIGGEEEKSEQAELFYIVGCRTGAHRKNKLAHLYLRTQRTGCSDPDQILASIKMNQLIRINSHRRTAHAGSHDRHAFALIIAGITVHISRCIELFCIRQKMFCDILCPQRIARKQNCLRNIALLCPDMRGRCVLKFSHMKYLLFFFLFGSSFSPGFPCRRGALFSNGSNEPVFLYT